MITAKNFKEEEFQRCNPSCSLQDMDQRTIDMFDRAREIAGIPFIPNSAFRSKLYEIKMGRAGTSSHTHGMAMDIKCMNDSQRLVIINALLTAGFNRIGVAKTYIHADNSHEHTPKLMWLY